MVIPVIESILFYKESLFNGFWLKKNEPAVNITNESLNKHLLLLDSSIQNQKCTGA